MAIRPKQPVWSVIGDKARAERTCQITGEKFIIEVPFEAYKRWRGGELIQRVFPELSADQREILITGYTPAEWKEIFK